MWKDGNSMARRDFQEGPDLKNMFLPNKGSAPEYINGLSIDLEFERIGSISSGEAMQTIG